MDPIEVLSRYPSSHFQAFQSHEEFDRSSRPHVDAVIQGMFYATQQDAQRPTFFHDHPVVLMVVNMMQKLSNWRYADVVFPSIDRGLSPTSFTIGDLNQAAFVYGSNALLANSCYDAGFTHLYEDKFQEHISWVNGEFNKQCSVLYAEYFRHVAGLAPSADYVAQYRSLFLSRAYRSLRRAQLANGSWKNPTMEVYIHLVKLLACGASIEEVQGIYQSFTTGEDAIDPGYFPSLTGDQWLQYRGWLKNDYLGCADLKAQNLCVVKLPPFPVGEVFVMQCQYYKNPVTSSCFSAQSPVLLADGTTRVISQIQEGDSVHSHVFSGGRRLQSTSTVAFISRPKRAGRTLYSYRAAPQIQFTDTHPLVDVHPTGLALKFVDPEIARSLNPSWKALPASRISPDVLEVHDGGSADPDEVLYDLVFEPSGVDLDMANVSSGPTTFTMVDDPHHHRFDVASEAPVFEWFPYTMRFFEHLLGSLLPHKPDFPTIISHLTDRTISLHHHFWGCWDEMARDACTRVQHTSHPSIPTDETFSVPLNRLLRFAISDGGETFLDPQTVADSFERLHTTLGRRVAHEICTGWADLPGTETIPILLLHNFQYSARATPVSQPPDRHLGFSWRVLQDGEQVAAREVHASRQGFNVFEMHDVIPLISAPSHSDGARWMLGFEVHEPATGVTYVGRSCGYTNKHAVVGLGGGQGNEHATIDVKVMQVSREALLAQKTWDHPMRMRFAAALGDIFAARLVAGQPSVLPQRGY